MAILELAPVMPVHCFCRNSLYNDDRSCRNLSLALFKTKKKKKKRWCNHPCDYYSARVSYELQSTSRRALCVVGRATSGSRALENNNNNNNVQNRSAFVELPVTCYQILGVPNHSEKDEVVKSMMNLKDAEVDEGFTMDAIVSRQKLLFDVRDKILFEPDYTGNIRERVPPKSSLRIPWAWLPGALCLLQEVGEEKLVLDIGQASLQHLDAKPYIHDLLLSMAYAECAIAKSSFEKNKIYQGFEALARAQRYLRSNNSLEKMTLLSEIERSLEELAPACLLDILDMPQTPENVERREGAVAALGKLLGKGLDVETTCQVQDWPGYLNQALNKLMATEIVELLNWDNLATIRKNKKSIESQNQRVVVDFNCFYIVLIAHIAVGFSSKQRDLVSKAKTICECLVATESEDLKFEEALCLFLLGLVDEGAAAERLLQVESNIKSTSGTLISGKEVRDVSNSKNLLETWLKGAVLGRFPDTRHCSPSLENFFIGEKKPSENKHRNGYLQTSSSINYRPISHSLVSDRRAFEEPISTSRHIWPAVKPLTTSNMQDPFIAGNSNSETNDSYPAVQLKRTLGVNCNRVWEIWLGPTNVVGYLSFVTVVVCILCATFKLMGVQFGWMRSAPSWVKPRVDPSSLACVTDSSLSKSWGSACNKGNSFASRFKKLLSTQKMHLDTGPGISELQDPSLVASSSSFMTAAYKRPMHMEEAEILVKQWQAIKAEALGPNYQVHSLFDVLDESMLVQWQALADAAKSRSCFWKFVLLHLSVVRAEILSDGTGKEMAEIEALLEEAAELVDVSQAKNPNYYSTYTIRYILRRQDNGSWRFCHGDIQTPS